MLEFLILVSGLDILLNHLLWGVWPQKKPKLELRYVIPHQFVSLCAMLLLVTHTTIPRMSRACIHLGMHDNHVSNGTCHESVDLAYQHVAK